jgi:hypothetical protein
MVTMTEIADVQITTSLKLSTSRINIVFRKFDRYDELVFHQVTFAQPRCSPEIDFKASDFKASSS